MSSKIKSIALTPALKEWLSVLSAPDKGVMLDCMIALCEEKEPDDTLFGQHHFMLLDQLKELLKIKNTRRIDYNSESQEVLDKLNKVTGSNYTVKNKLNMKLLSKLFSTGYSVQDCIKVIELKAAEWLNTKYENYLRPQTLFGEKFESYFNAKPAKQSESFTDKVRKSINGSLPKGFDSSNN